MLWLGVTRKRLSAMETIEVAFGPGDISVEAISSLIQYNEVQVRLVEGLRRLSRKESSEQLCEFMTDQDWERVRSWFCKMKRDTTNHVDIVEVQKWFAKM